MESTTDAQPATLQEALEQIQALKKQRSEKDQELQAARDEADELKKEAAADPEELRRTLVQQRRTIANLKAKDTAKQNTITTLYRQQEQARALAVQSVQILASGSIAHLELLGRCAVGIVASLPATVGNMGESHFAEKMRVLAERTELQVNTGGKNIHKRGCDEEVTVRRDTKVAFLVHVRGKERSDGSGEQIRDTRGNLVSHYRASNGVDCDISFQLLHDFIAEIGLPAGPLLFELRTNVKNAWEVGRHVKAQKVVEGVPPEDDKLTAHEKKTQSAPGLCEWVNGGVSSLTKETVNGITHRREAVGKEICVTAELVVDGDWDAAVAKKGWGRIPKPRVTSRPFTIIPGGSKKHSSERKSNHGMLGKPASAAKRKYCDF